ncbi:MAG: alkaline phosphatase [Pseudomonadota bacterium]
MKTRITLLAACIMGSCTVSFANDTPLIFDDVENPINAQQWYNEGLSRVEQNKAIASAANTNANSKAKNVILFIGDGMGISTLTAARIFLGQKNGNTGEENELFFERFPNLALAKTYNTNQQTPDSAGTMTAMMSGIKSDAGVISVNQDVIRGDCDSMSNNSINTYTLLEYAEIAKMSTGIVSTARITHATPAATYAHIMDRNFEDDRDASKFSNPGNCKDIASQLIDLPQFAASFGYDYVDGLEVALGGGRRSFIQRVDGADPEGGGQGEREDGRDLTQEWLSKYSNSAYVWNKQDFDNIDTSTTDHLLGLFEMSHMEYEADRETDAGGEPSLSAMTSKAIQILNKNDNGFFLMVEAGRIDHAHHATNPYRAMTDTIAFMDAVKAAYNATNPEETLIIVTADHSHVFTLAGYPTRGNPILGKVVGNDSSGSAESEPLLAKDGLPYTTVGYTNGRGFHLLPTGGDAIYDEAINAGRADLTAIETTSQGFHPEVLIPLSSETHAMEDVAIYATGPGSSLVNGLMEQNAIYHVMTKALDLTARVSAANKNITQ